MTDPNTRSQADLSQQFHRTLLIDDEESVLSALSLLLQAIGFSVTSTPDPKEGIRLISEHSYDLILCDLRMPPSSGMEVLCHYATHYQTTPPIEPFSKELFSKEPGEPHASKHETRSNEGLSAPIFILISGHATDREIVEAKERGAHGFLAKPFTPDQLFSLLSTLSASKG